MRSGFHPLLMVTSGFAKGMEATTAPVPIFGLGDESTLHWVPVHVAEFLGPLARCEHVEVVEVELP